MKRQKLTVNKLAFGNLKARKKQYTLMIIGIVLAMIFSSGVMFFVFSLSSSIQELYDKGIGKQDAVLNASQNYDMDYLLESGTVKEHGFAYVIGYGYTDEIAADQGTSIARLDKKAEEISYIKAKEGRMPEKKGEIAIEYDALNRLGLFYSEIGDEITLKFRIADGDDYLPEETEKTYILVGKLWDKRPNIEYAYGDKTFYPSAVISSEDEVDLGGKENVICFIALKNGMYSNDSFMDAGIAAGIKSGDEGYFDHYNCIITTSNHWAFSEKYDMKFTLIIAIILSGVLMIASCTGIVNSFNTNLLERKKQIGMLRAVGATKRQIIRIFGREAFLIAAVTTPLSLIISYFLVKAIIGAMGDDFVFIPEWWVLAVCGVFGVFCVMAAAFIPLYIASRISPMQAIRNTELMRKMKNKRIHSKKEFNAPKLIAKRNLVFYRKKQVAVSVILIATIIFTSFGFSLVAYTLKYDMDNYVGYGDYHVQDFADCFRFVNIRGSHGFSENERQDIVCHPYVSEALGRKEGKVCILTNEYTDYMRVIDYMDSERFLTNGGLWNRSYEDFLNIYGKTESDFYINTRELLEFSEHLFPTEIHSFEASEFTRGMENCVYEGEINIEKLNSGEEIVLYAPEKIGFHKGKDTYGTLDMDKYEKGEVLVYGIEPEDIKTTVECGYKVGDTVKISTLISNTYFEDDNKPPKKTERYDREVKIAAIITDFSDSSGYFRGDYLDFFTTLEGFEKIVPDYRYWSFDINLAVECAPGIDEEITSFLKSFQSGNDGRGYFFSKFSTDEENRKTVAGVLVAIVSIAILFFCICASVINNQLTAQIRENKREIGTLRAVGASAKELTQSYFRQLLSMFGWGCGIGFGLYTVIWFVVYLFEKYINFSSRYYPYQIWEAILICLLLLAICFVNLYSKVKKQMKYSIVENIREL